MARIWSVESLSEKQYCCEYESRLVFWVALAELSCWVDGEGSSWIACRRVHE